MGAPQFDLGPRPLLGRLSRKLVRWRGRMMGWREERAGQCLLCGSAEDVAVFADALAELQRCDDELACGVLMAPWLIHRSGSRSLFNSQWLLCGLADAWMTWKEQGVIIPLVYLSFLRRYRAQGRERAGHEARDAVSTWAKERGFPAGLLPPLSA